MKILVTGATGFLGNYVIHNLLKNGVEVVASARNEEKAKTFDWYAKVTFVSFDIKETQNFSSNLWEHFQSPDKMIHLAWEGLPNYKALFHFEQILFQQYYFLKAITEAGLRDLTVTGTCFEYGMQSGCLTEETPAIPANSYAIAKDTLRKMMEILNSNQSFNFKWIRLFYMYGKGQAPSSLFTQLDKAIEQNASPFNMSGGEQIRDFLSVEKVVEHICQIAFLEANIGVVNCCSGAPQTVKTFVENYLKERGVELPLNLGYYPYPTYEPMEFWGGVAKLKSILTSP